MWKYYNHAMIPDIPPNEEVDISCLEDGSIWNVKEGRPLFARWTTDYDCGYETEWWYIVKDGPFIFEEIAPKKRKHIRQALKKVDVKLIDPKEYAAELCEVHNSACDNYKNYNGGVTKEKFLQNSGLDWWAAFDKETQTLIGYMSCERGDGFVNFITAKHSPDYLHLGGSAAIYYTVLEFYLNQLKFSHVFSGNRNINHVTNVQEYKIKTFNFRKAYCKLHLAYNPKYKWIIKIAYAFRKLLAKLDKINIIHSLNSVLKMEEIVRRQDKQ